MQKQKNAFISTLQKWMILISLLFLCLAIIAIIKENKSNFNLVSQKFFKEYVYLHKEIIKEDVDNIVNIINAHKRKLADCTPDVLKQEQEKLLNQLKGVAFSSKKRYVFILKYDGTALMHPRLTRYNLCNMRDENGVKILQHLHHALNFSNGVFSSYIWKNPETNQKYKKIVFVRRIKDWNWIVCSGVSMNNALTEIKTLCLQFDKDLQRRILYYIIIFVFIFICLFTLFNTLMKNWKNDLSVFTAFFREAELYHHKIDTEKMYFYEFRALGEMVNNMLKKSTDMQSRLHEEQEERIVTINSISDGLITTDKNGKIELMNNAAEELTGYQLSDVSGKPLNAVFKIIDNLSKEIIDNPLDQAFRKNINIKSMLSPLLITANGDEYYIDYNATPVLDANNKLIGGVIVFRDMTEKIELDNELVKIRRLESIGLLAGGIAHDFNNILTGIYGNIEIATNKLSKEHPAYNFLSRAFCSMERAKKLTNQLLTFAKGGAPIIQHINLKSIVESTVKFHMSGSHIKTHIKIPDDLWQVKADGSQISQVIENLTINAKQSMKDGGNLYITLENIPKGTIRKLHIDCVKFEIRDEGTGIAKDKLTKIFDPYYTTKDVGYGLGLYSKDQIYESILGKLKLSQLLVKEPLSLFIYLQ